MQQTEQAKFLTGSTMRHVVVMTLSGSLGLTFMFLVDLLSLFWVAQLGEDALTSAISMAGTLQFLTISVGIGLMIASVALTSRALGQGDRERARRIVTSSAMLTFAVMTLAAVLILIYRVEVLALLGAEGDAAEAAARLLTITLPTLPIMSLGFIGSAALRAVGDAWRSMAVTSVAGLVALLLDPFLVIEWSYWGIPFGLGLGLDGAAIVMVIARISMAILAFWFVLRVHDLAAPPSLRNLRNILRPYFGIALPAMATQLSTPIGGMIALYAVSGYGDSAIAGVGVIGRMQMVAFGGIFALSGAIGGIIGQNYGAQQFDRVQRAYKDSVLFCLIYTGVAWALIAALVGPVSDVFNLSTEGRAVYAAFAYVMAGSMAFQGAQFVSNAAFNNLGRPIWATISNWTRDFVLMYPLTILGAMLFAAPGVVYGQALAGVLAGGVTVVIGWRFVKGLAPG